jgi:hypothetical protein
VTQVAAFTGSSGLDLAVLRRRVKRPLLRRMERVLLAAASRLVPRDRWAPFPVTPQTCCAGTGSS